MEPPRFKDEQLIDYVKACAAKKGAVTFNLGIFQDGDIGPATQKQMQALPSLVTSLFMDVDRLSCALTYLGSPFAYAACEQRGGSLNSCRIILSFLPIAPCLSRNSSALPSSYRCQPGAFLPI
jgi:Tfp pilus assembly protein PilW